MHTSSTASLQACAPQALQQASDTPVWVTVSKWGSGIFCAWFPGLDLDLVHPTLWLCVSMPLPAEMLSRTG